MEKLFQLFNDGPGRLLSRKSLNPRFATLTELLIPRGVLTQSDDGVYKSLLVPRIKGPTSFPNDFFERSSI
jgi:hypothetical protein